MFKFYLFFVAVTQLLSSTKLESIGEFLSICKSKDTLLNNRWIKMKLWGKNTTHKSPWKWPCSVLHFLCLPITCMLGGKCKWPLKCLYNKKEWISNKVVCTCNPPLGKLRQEDWVSEACLGYRRRSHQKRKEGGEGKRIEISCLMNI